MTARARALLLAGLTALFFAGCGGHPQTSPGVSRVSLGDHETGLASWYGPDYHGNQTASGERYNMFELTAAQ